MTEEKIKRVKKVWGEEQWIVNNNLYCGKKMILKKGFRCSIHHHKVKDETFYIQSGKVLIEIGKEAEEEKVMLPGDRIHIPTNTWHRFTGLKDSEIFEFSTKHMDEDSYRCVDSGAVDIDEIIL